MTQASSDAILSRYSHTLSESDGIRYRDLNHNGRLDVYEDPRQPVEARVDDLLKQMTPAEKAGLLFINGSMINVDGSIEPIPGEAPYALHASQQLRELAMNHFNLWNIPGVWPMATWHNRLQALAEESRLGIPVTIASDPRNHFTRNIFSMAATEFSQWCETLGFGALDDPELVQRFADIARREYLAVGIRLALHPQVDLATEPRWPRVSGTFGEDAEVSARLVRAYIRGFQGARIRPGSVACMTKHFPGGGPQKDGWDPHFPFQQGQVYPGNNFNYHLIPFEAAIDAGTAAMMPYYGVPVDQTDENVAMGFNKAILTGLLRNQLGFKGIICTDWGLISDLMLDGVVWPARAWGVEHLSRAERVLKALEAGVDQFGGESCPDLVVELLESGRLPMERVDQSARRLLRLKFELGLFDQPFVDEDRLEEVFNNPETLGMGLNAQSRAMTLLKNDAGSLPLGAERRVYVSNLDAGLAAQYARVVATPEEADFAILRLDTPWQPADTTIPMALAFHHGDLDFKGEKLEEILRLLRTVPTVVVIYLDRPAVIPEISTAAAVLLGDYGASDQAVLDVVFGRVQPAGRLPFELPSSMEAVRTQFPDVPSDSVNPLYPFGFGL